jgi:hypothetical protein
MDTDAQTIEAERTESSLVLEDRLRDRLITLMENREKFITDAQRQLAALDAVIAEFKALIDPATAKASLNGASDAESP